MKAPVAIWLPKHVRIAGDGSALRLLPELLGNDRLTSVTNELKDSIKLLEDTVVGLADENARLNTELESEKSAHEFTKLLLVWIVVTLVLGFGIWGVKGIWG